MTGLRRRVAATATVFALLSLVASAQDAAQNVQAAAAPLLALYRTSPAAIRALFVTSVTNEFFQLQPGTTYFYEGTKEGVVTRDEIRVTDQTILILNVACTVVHDQAFENNVLAEDTLDYFAQDVSGNVWYFGEDTKELDAKGHVVSTEGTWRAGVNGAAPGLIMEARSAVGDVYSQELAAGVAEDQAVVRSLNANTCVPFDCFNHVLRTTETSRFEPGVVAQKFYASGIGLIREDIIAGGHEHSALVRITRQ